MAEKRPPTASRAARPTGPAGGPAAPGRPSRPRHKKAPWWRQAKWSVITVLILLVVVAVTAAVLTRQVSSALPVVGRDKLGEDPWTDPLGIEQAGVFQIAHLPDCAAGPVVRLMLWDNESNPYWQVSGPPTALTTFAVGATPEGWTLDVPYTAPARDAVVRLVAIRTVKGAAGVRYTAGDVVDKRVVSLLPLTRFTIAGFQTADVCGRGGKAKKPGESVASSTIPTDGGVGTVPTGDPGATVPPVDPGAMDPPVDPGVVAPPP